MLKTKIFFIILSIFFVISIFFYYTLDKSYSLSSEAKAAFKNKDYDLAYNLSSKAYEINQYNRMAFTLMIQSKETKKWKQFIKQAQKYMKFIDNVVTNSKTIKNSDKARIKMIKEIIESDYKKLNFKNSFIDNELKKESKKLYSNIIVVSQKILKE